MAILVVAALAASCSSEPSNPSPTQNYNAQASIGRWCAQPTTVAATWQLTEIVERPSLAANITYGDGSTRSRPLTRDRASAFTVTNDPRGERYEIDGAGYLLSLDQEGVIWSATPMQPTQAPATCLQGG